MSDIQTDAARERTPEAEVVDITQGGAEVVKAEVVHLRQGGAYTVHATHMTVEQGGVAWATCDTLTVEQGGVGAAQTNVFRVKDGGVGVVVAQHAELTNARTLLLLSGDVHGNVETVLDTRGAALAGIAAGAAIGLMLIIGGLLGRRK